MAKLSNIGIQPAVLSRLIHISRRLNLTSLGRWIPVFTGTTAAKSYATLIRWSYLVLPLKAEWISGWKGIILHPTPLRDASLLSA